MYRGTNKRKVNKNEMAQSLNAVIKTCLSLLLKRHVQFCYYYLLLCAGIVISAKNHKLQIYDK